MARKFTTKRITEAAFIQLIQPLIGLPITKVWRGYGSAIFLELGTLQTSMEAGKLMENGEATIMIEWSWRVKKARSILFGSWSSDRKITSCLNKLTGASIEKLGVVGRLPELEIKLSNGLFVSSFMTAEGQPEWAILFPDRPPVTVYGGVLVRQQPIYK